MSGKYKGKHKVDTPRAKYWDYSWNGAYFVTLNTKNRVKYFGSVENGEMALSEIGQIAHNCWEEIPQHFPFVRLGAFVIMPDHVHGVIVINKSTESGIPSEYLVVAKATFNPNTFGPQSQNLASIVRGYKVGVTKNTRKIVPTFAWQPKYHDHIIKDERAYNNIETYIVNNPKNWKK